MLVDTFDKIIIALHDAAGENQFFSFQCIFYTFLRDLFDLSVGIVKYHKIYVDFQIMIYAICVMRMLFSMTNVCNFIQSQYC